MTTSHPILRQPAAAAGAVRSPGSVLRRPLGLVRTELLLLRRNRMALTMAVLMPVAMMSGLHSMLHAQRAQLPGVDLNSALVLNLTAVSLLFAFYPNLTSAYVARRNELVLKRLRTGELTDTGILGGTALPPLLLVLLQVTLISALGAVLLGVSAPVNPVLVPLGLLLAGVQLAALAALTSAATRTVETAGLTTLPVVLVAIVASGVVVPYRVMPGWLADLGRALPTTPALQLLRIGWLGGDGAGAASSFAGSWAVALPYLAGALAWTAATAWAAHRYFRWEPRR
ncbi:ABC transporter permease [Kitasatospora sp. LaBMicrA B282]|uniref:ABC transporter permease n=1 Tax=Kitasatospora sp. LaBMicrA B282 TaxID=3420949 RepID=UPI003D14A7B9